MVPMDVLGPVDGQTQIHNTGLFPWCSIASLLIQFPRGTVIGTAWLVARNVVVTAGHCVYDSRYEGWAVNAQVVPGRNGNSAPFGTRLGTVF